MPKFGLQFFAQGGFVTDPTEKPSIPEGVITYNGIDIKHILPGQTATLECAGKLALGDIVIAFMADGSVTCGQTVTQVAAGKTATLSCGGKKMMFDVVITV